MNNMPAPMMPDWLPETGSSEDFGHVVASPQPLTGIPKPTIVPPKAAPVAPTRSLPQPTPTPPVAPPPPPAAPIFKPVVNSVPVPPVKPQPAVAAGGLSMPFPPAPPPPSAAPVYMEVVAYPAAPQATQPPLAVNTNQTAANPYQPVAVKAPKIPRVAPVAAAMGGNIIAQKKEAPVILKILGKGVAVVAILAILTGIIYSLITGLVSLPNFSGILGTSELASLLQSVNWVIPASLLGIGFTFITFGYLLQRSSRM